MRHTGLLWILSVLVSWTLLPEGWSQPPLSGAPAVSPALRQALQHSLDRGLAYLAQEQQPTGAWQRHSGLTAVAATSFLQYPGGVPAQYRPAVENALAFVVSCAKPDGGIYQRDLQNYNTAVAITALVAAGKPEYQPLVQKAQEFLLTFQADEGEGFEKSDKFYGGIGYGTDLRPDLANLEYALRALKAAGVPAQHPVWDKAIVFLQRTQNRSESNDQPWAGNDGGFVYYPGFSYAGGTASYGSMTLAGVLSFYYANLRKDDPRVQDALRWIRQHYTVEENPGLRNKTLYYYYMVFAKALHIYDEPIIVDVHGVPHNWREDLGRKLLAVQYPEGYWVNDDPSWWMDNKVLVTAFATMALEHILHPQGAVAW
jgi:squalene-hopene/tetraprenyl-beta-curcumene cyclase